MLCGVCSLLLLGRFLHLCVLYGYQGAVTDSEQLALTDQLFDAALGELYVAALGQPCLLVGDFNVEPTKIPCLAKGISAGLWVDFGEAWAIASGLQPAPTCKRSWTAASGRRRDFILGCPLAAAAILSCNVQSDRWIAPHLAVRALFVYGRWDAWVAQFVRCTPLWPASWLPVVDKTRGSKSAEVQRGWEVYDERLQFMSRRDALLLDESLGLDDVSMAWAVWSRAAESALGDAFSAEAAFTDAYQFLVVVLFLLEVWCWVGVLLCFAGFSLVVLGCAGHGPMLLMLLMLLMFSCIVITRLLLCLI